ncbi:hypothetical protein [Adonisia turfae]|uniref:Uncharacterized protein n=1 Tax=Adonisia turfae CCMR0081 TaxID=2292702 RepID=A0A6M0RVA8_9CYAN|nr:hypothetical protein [Adonisia turfae]NEZ60158.1 hypothetical protein [Adonisia turfae CCMR0081]
MNDEILRRLNQIEQELRQIEPRIDSLLENATASTDLGYVIAEVNALVFRMLIKQGVKKMMPIVNLCVELEDFVNSLNGGSLRS